ncbi:hypothetical protein F8388_010253 [Cannabis sativa]|uniref:Protein kinase domain-containing protein n=1 Tax=Cannabis sativa TaxID=3483 RepID=A0A7J6GS07_CANSA|nr:hypothetical protein F8388_010253 [Cannabis sativa]
MSWFKNFFSCFCARSIMSNSSKHNTNYHEEEDLNINQNQPPPHPSTLQLQEPSSSSLLEAAEELNSNPRSNVPQIFTYNELDDATNNFSHIVNLCGFGYVYKGTLPNSNQVVAVKRVGESEYLVKSHMLSLLSHQNLVTLVGYFSQGNIHLLVYEFMPLYSLKDHLFIDRFPRRRRPLDWNNRMKIALGVAKGLEYLHNGTNRPVVHGNLTPSNVLLGQGFNPKLTDFGLPSIISISKVGLDPIGLWALILVTQLQSTLQIEHCPLRLTFIALEYYCFISSLEIKPSSIGGAVQAIMKDKYHLIDIADLSLSGQYPKDCLESVLELAGLCVKNDAEERPNIIEVVQQLEILEANNTITQISKNVTRCFYSFFTELLSDDYYTYS